MQAATPPPARVAMHHEHGAAHQDHAGMHHEAPAADPAAHDCCERDGFARPHCCPESEQLAQQGASSAERASHGFQLAAAQPVAASLAPVTTGPAPPPRPAALGSTPATLISQHTSLLV
jgi:hypothetical protein